MGPDHRRSRLFPRGGVLIAASRPAPFITFEGGEGAGKSTQLARLRERLRTAGVAVLATREPGGTPGAEAIRRLLLDGTVEKWRPLAELYLFLAARADHVARVIAPALAAGRWVLCDRFADSTRVYQGLAGGLGLELVDRLQEPALGGLVPDLTILLDLPPETGLRRRRTEGGDGRFEAKGLAFHGRIREGFLELARREPDRFLVLDASLPERSLEARIWREVETRFGSGR